VNRIQNHPNIEKADAQKTTMGFRYVPTADPYRMKVGDNFRPQADTQLENQINRY
jgi:hypothetical protein